MKPLCGEKHAGLQDPGQGAPPQPPGPKALCPELQQANAPEFKQLYSEGGEGGAAVAAVYLPPNRLHAGQPAGHHKKAAVAVQ